MASDSQGVESAPETPEPHRFGPIGSVAVHFRRTLSAGVLVMLPIGITVLVLKFFFDILDPVLEPAVERLPGPEITGAGFFALLILIYVIGLVAAQVLGRRLIAFGHSILEVIPVVKSIYGTTRTAVQLLSTGNKENYKGVVLIDFPMPGTKSIGLITSRILGNDGIEMLSVYIPTTPIPSSGFLVIVPVTKVQVTDMSVEDAMSVVISGGILSDRVFQRSGLSVPSKPNSNQ